MMTSRRGLTWIEPLTPVSERSEPPESPSPSPSPYLDSNTEVPALDVADEVEEAEEIEPPPAAVPFSRLFACAENLMEEKGEVERERERQRLMTEREIERERLMADLDFGI